MHIASLVLRMARKSNHAAFLAALFCACAFAQSDASANSAVAHVQVAPDPDVSTSTNATSAAATPEPADYGQRTDIGYSTNQLFEMQRSAQASRPRNIDGEQASRSYQRYLKSFETVIPEQFETGMNLKKQ
ncbi:MAG: DUF3613 domain-containing protein [Comamonas sp.]